MIPRDRGQGCVAGARRVNVREGKLPSFSPTQLLAPSCRVAPETGTEVILFGATLLALPCHLPPTGQSLTYMSGRILVPASSCGEEGGRSGPGSVVELASFLSQQWGLLIATDPSETPPLDTP